VGPENVTDENNNDGDASPPSSSPSAAEASGSHMRPIALIDDGSTPSFAIVID
jgi:hypothetical protein